MEISGNRFFLEDPRDAFRGVGEQSTRLVVGFKNQGQSLVWRGTVGSVLDAVSRDVRQQLEAQACAPDGKILSAVVHLDCDVINDAAGLRISISLIEPSRAARKEDSEKWKAINSGPSQQVCENFTRSTSTWWLHNTPVACRSCKKGIEKAN